MGHVIKMPGVHDCVRYMCPENNKEYYANLRKLCRISSMTVPREAHGDWLDIRIWADRRGVEKADRLLNRRLASFYEKTREIVEIKPCPVWSIQRWLKQLASWRKKTGAQ